MLPLAAILFGLTFLFVGILGFVPGVTTNHMLLGIFHVNAAHNIVHLLTGLAALLAGAAGPHAAQLYFRIFGAVYAAVALLGFVAGSGLIFGLISNNPADSWLHLAIATISLTLGFAVKELGHTLHGAHSA